MCVGKVSIQDPRSSERYQPRWELWMPVFIHYAVMNVVNSLATFHVTTQSMQGIMVSETKAAWDKLIGNVLILESHIMDLWREKALNKLDEDFEKARIKFHSFISDSQDEAPNSIKAMEESTTYYHEILQLLWRRGRLRFKPPRSFGRKHED
jgi:hypothetical protein